MKTAHIALLCAAATLASGQMLPVPEGQSTAWNSSFKFSPEQVKLGELSPGLATSLEVILNFDRTQLANGGPSQDIFYNLTEGSSNIPPNAPGQVLKVEHVTNPVSYNIPAKTALSRIIYSSTNLNGTLIPASAYVLWPYTPKQFGLHSKGERCRAPPKAKAPVVLWTHGTAGFYADAAPSAHRSLFYGDIIPFTLAQAGYVVIATDYAGLGVETSWDGSFVPHQYGAREAGAGDALNAFRAVRTTFSDRITDNYVVVGHSQGGAVSWGISEALAKEGHQYCDVEEGYLGTLTFSPGILFLPGPFLPWVGKFLSGVFPTFKLSDWFTPLGVSRTKLFTQVQGGQYFSELLFSNATEVINPDWDSSYYADVFSKLANPGNRPYKGPMLIIQGTADPLYNGTLATYDSTCKTYPGDLEHMKVPGAGHFPAIDASREVWLKWIEDRFEGRPVESKGCVKSALESFLPVEQYQEVTRSFFQWSGAPSWFAQLPVGSY
ncbi:secretory lipase [Lipomyces kononenkoae]|uniref:Secretory lipase n=1 Tax=Lipomyces kononenkoae TaxID=34357 RepID=A0ACC3SUD5_LIPKO